MTRLGNCGRIGAPTARAGTSPRTRDANARKRVQQHPSQRYSRAHHRSAPRERRLPRFIWFLIIGRKHPQKTDGGYMKFGRRGMLWGVLGVAAMAGVFGGVWAGAQTAPAQT